MSGMLVVRDRSDETPADVDRRGGVGGADRGPGWGLVRAVGCAPRHLRLAPVPSEEVPARMGEVEDGHSRLASRP